MPDEHIRSGHACLRQEKMKIFACLVETVEFRPRIAPGIPGTIVGADSGEPRNLRLNKLPIERERSAAVLHYDRRSPVTRAMNVQPPPADIDQLARWGRIVHSHGTNHGHGSHDAKYSVHR